MSVVIYTTSITQPPRQRGLQEHLIRTLSTLRIPFTICDVSMDEAGKRLWRRRGRTDGRLPGILVDEEYVGSLEEYEYAVEDGRVPEFLGIDPPGPAPPVAPRTYTGVPPKIAQALSASSATPTSTLTTTAEVATSQPLARSPGLGADAPPTESAKARPSAADDDAEVDQLIEDAGEDELEKLLRELEGM